MTTIEAISQLNKIFKSKDWTVRDIDEFVFDNFCKLLDNINITQRKLIIELIEKYQWISIADYPNKILKIFDEIEPSEITKLKVIYLFPIIKPEDEGGFKSGQFLIYQIKAFKRHLKNYNKITFKLISKFSDISKLQLKNNEALFLIDDYIGSGETLNICLNQIQTNTSLKNENINIIAIATQEEIYLTKIKKGYQYYANHILKKGISDYNKDDILNEKINIMLELEKMIPGGSHFSLGYNNSEALITLARTPDNTFPIFWKEYKKGKEKFEAPFSREEIIEL